MHNRTRIQIQWAAPEPTALTTEDHGLILHMTRTETVGQVPEAFKKSSIVVRGWQQRLTALHQCKATLAR